MKEKLRTKKYRESLDNSKLTIRDGSNGDLNPQVTVDLTLDDDSGIDLNINSDESQV